MAEVRKGAKKSLTITALGQWIWGKETIFGPLIRLEVATDGTVGVFDDEKALPTTAPTVKLDPTGKGTCGDDSEVCRGEAYVSGTIMKVLVCR
ncbi:MAG TPA: hypothetical protein VF702_06570 [Allosphingosinicella sp.]|jgi:hypothetical protein